MLFHFNVGCSLYTVGACEVKLRECPVTNIINKTIINT